MVDKKGVPQFFQIMVVGYSGVGNIKITTTHMSKASDLMKYGKDIANIITKNEVLLVLPDMEHYCVKINKVLTWCGNNKPMSIDLIHEELCTYLQGYKSMKQWWVLRWLGNEETIHAKEFTSIVIDLTNKQDRDNLLETARLKLFNLNCTITPYEERPQLFQCSKCGMFLHWTSSCRQPRCTLCSSKSHDMEDHPPNEKLKCINCKGEHPSNHKACNTR